MSDSTRIEFDPNALVDGIASANAKLRSVESRLDTLALAVIAAFLLCSIFLLAKVGRK